MGLAAPVSRLSRLALAVGIALGMVLPLCVYAQSDLQTSVRAAIMADPRTAQLSEAQIDVMVAALSQEAQQRGVTPADIAWRPGEDILSQSANEFCGSFPVYLCVISASYGFLGPDYLWPIWLGIASLLLILLLALRSHHERAAAASMSASATMATPMPSQGGPGLQS